MRRRWCLMSPRACILLLLLQSCVHAFSCILSLSISKQEVYLYRFPNRRSICIFCPCALSSKATLPQMHADRGSECLFFLQACLNAEAGVTPFISTCFFLFVMLHIRIVYPLLCLFPSSCALLSIVFKFACMHLACFCLACMHLACICLACMHLSRMHVLACVCLHACLVFDLYRMHLQHAHVCCISRSLACMHLLHAFLCIFDFHGVHLHALCISSSAADLCGCC